MSEERDDWLRRIELYLDVGSDGVVVLVDRARDAHIGTLVRALLRKHPDLSIVVSPEELRSAAKGNVVIYHARSEDAEQLNLIRPVLKDRGLRVVLWAQGNLASELPLRAPDLYDWISHRVLCPQRGAPRFVSAGLRAAATAQRPVGWEGALSDLRAGVNDAWPDTQSRVVSDGDYDALVDALASTADYVIIAPQTLQLHRARWAMAEANRHARVAVLAAAASPIERAGLWILSSHQVDVRTAFRRVAAAVLDLEPHPVEWIPSLNRRAMADWERRYLTKDDPGAARAERLKVRGAAERSVVRGDAPPAMLRAWGADVVAAPYSPERGPPDSSWLNALAILQRDRLIASAPTTELPPAIQVECTLWRERHQEWPTLAEVAAKLGHHDVAVRWDLRQGSEGRALASHLETGIAGAASTDVMRLLDLAASRLDGATPAWYESLRARALCDAGDLRAVRALSTTHSFDAATAAYLDTLAGEWGSAMQALGTLGSSEDLGPLRKSGIAVAAWACDAAPAVKALLVPTPVKALDRARAIWWRWLPALDFEQPLALNPDHPSEDPFLFPDAPEESARTWLAAAAAAERRLEHSASAVYAVRGLAELEHASPREHVLEGVLLMMQGRALARLGQPDRAIDKLALADRIVVRTTENPLHPWALIARVEHAWLRAQHRGGPVEEVDAALAQLEGALWPEHRELREARKLRARLSPG